MAQSHSSSDDVFKDSLNFVKKLWGGMNVPGVNMPGMPTMPGMTVPTMSLEELDKRIQELKSVEAWLNLNANMVRSSVQALEVQRATIAALHSLSAGMTNAMPESAPDASPFIHQSAAWWNVVQEQFKQALAATVTKDAADKSDDTGADKAATKTTRRSSKSSTIKKSGKVTKPAKSRQS